MSHCEFMTERKWIRMGMVACIGAREAQYMRRTASILVVAFAMAEGGLLAKGQIIDPSTGMMVDAANLPMDFSAIMSGQRTNIGMEAALSANAQTQAIAEANMAAADASAQASIDGMNAVNAIPPVKASVLPITPRQVITPAGRSFNGVVELTIADTDAGGGGLLYDGWQETQVVVAEVYGAIYFERKGEGAATGA